MRKNKQIFHRSLSIAATWIIAMCLHAAYPQSSAIALPAGTVEGHLKNGFHYLILPNSTPASKVEFRLIMRVGSIQETEEEKGCAHFLEHIAFGGTTHFPKRSLVESLEKLGMKYGQDINALTGFDRTIYMFSVPIDKNREAVIANSLLIIRDWMDGLTIEAEKVENEKGIILEELRSFDSGDDFYPLKIGNGLLSRRMPLGNADDIKRITPEILTRYYRKWYVPSLATLVVVGDISPQEIEQKIKVMFASLKCGSSSILPHPCILEYDTGISLSEIRDSLRNQTRIECIIPHTCNVERTLDDVVQKQRRRLLIKAISSRLHALKLQCEVSDQWYLGNKNHFVLSLEGKNRKKLLTRMAKIVTELHCLARNGWEANEWQDLKNDFRSKYEIQTVPITRNSAEWCDDFIDYAISGDCYLTDKIQQRKVWNKISDTTCEDLQQLLNEWLTCKQNTMLVTCLSHPEFGTPLTKREVATAWEKGEKANCQPYNYVRSPQAETEVHSHIPACLAVRPTFDSAYIANTKLYPLTGIREVTLKNGIRLILKPTLQPERNFLLTSFAPFGLSSIPDKDYPLLEGTASYMDMGGIANVDGEKLSDYLYNQGMSLTTVIENHWHGFMGMSSSANALEFFNLIYEKIIDPKLNYKDFEESLNELLKTSGKETMLEKMLKRDSSRLLTARINELMGETLPASYRQPTTEQLQQLRLDSIATFYKALYSRQEGTTYIICGHFNADTLINQFVSVFGRMPISSKQEQWTYPKFRLPNMRITEGFPNTNKTQTLFDYIFFGHYQPGLKNTLTLKLMCNVIQNRLISILREQESLVYSPYVSLKYEGIPWSTFYFDINASTDNENMNKIEATLLKLLRHLQEKEVSEEELLNIKRSFLIAKRETLNAESASAWRTTLTSLLKNGETIADFEDYEQQLADITPDILHKAFNKYLDIEKYILLYISKNNLKK
ncbi:pitrilysin family protein [Bacteroides helcogenes]|nr:M16 family metallopeptidase [Bacteroides helcogenes]MDY5239311.1 insulinase family protein [Bacteroides helcogenes]